MHYAYTTAVWQALCSSFDVVVDIYSFLVNVLVWCMSLSFSSQIKVLWQAGVVSVLLATWFTRINLISMLWSFLFIKRWLLFRALLGRLILFLLVICLTPYRI